jgi:hypothetical protein
MAEDGKFFIRHFIFENIFFSARPINVPQRKFLRTRRAEIFTRQSQKVYRPVYRKGIVLVGGEQQYETRPFGWFRAEAQGNEEEEDDDDDESIGGTDDDDGNSSVEDF